MKSAEFERAEEDVPDAVIDFFETTYSPAQTVETLTQWQFQRMPPLALT